MASESTIALPDLATIESRVMYRIRPKEETEEATWDHPYNHENASQPAPCVQVRLKSLRSEIEAQIIFHNTSTSRIRALWLDFKGNEVAYSVIESGAKKRYRTFVSHPWIVREVASGKRMMLNDSMVVVGQQEEQTCSISPPPRLPWSRETHRFYPEPFKAAVKGLLLAHHRLSGPPRYPGADLLPGRSPSKRVPLSASNPMTLPKRGTALAALSPKLARRPAPAPAALQQQQQQQWPASAAQRAASLAQRGDGSGLAAGASRGLARRIIRLCISPFMPSRERSAQVATQLPQQGILAAAAAEPLLYGFQAPAAACLGDGDDDLTVHLGASVTSSLASEPIRAVRFDDSAGEAELLLEEQVQQERPGVLRDAGAGSGSAGSWLSGVLDVLTAPPAKMAAPLHLGSLHFDLVWQILLAAVPDTVFQDVGLELGARPDIRPAHLPEDPFKFEAQQQAAAAAAAAAAQPPP